MAKQLTREEWLAERREGIGASDTPAILGLSPWRSPLDVWAEKTGTVEPDDLSDNEAVEFGNRLEGVIAEAFAERTGRDVHRWPSHHSIAHPDHPWMRCTPDAEDDQGLIQIKTTSEYKSNEWKDEPPLHYQVQVQHEMAVCNADQDTLVVLIGGNKLRWFDVPRNQAFIDVLIPRLAEFWRLVESETMPPVDGSLATARVLSRLYPEDNGTVVDLSPVADAVDWAATLDEAKAMVKKAEALKREAENNLKAAIGDASFAVLADGRTFSHKLQERKEHLVKASSFRVLRAVKKLPKALQAAPMVALPQLQRRLTNGD